MKGTLPLKLRLRGCKPLRRASGTTSKAMLQRLKRMCYALVEQGRTDLIDAMADGRLVPMAVFNRYKFGKLDELPHADSLVVFAEAWPRWHATFEASDFHRATAEQYCRRLVAMNEMGETGSIAALPVALREFRATHRLHARTFNMARTVVMAFLRDTVGQRHPLWNAVADIPPIKVKPVRHKHPLTPDELKTLCRALGHPWGAMAWTMATTGMGWKEYVGEWRPERGGLQIDGTKTGGRVRLIPLVSILTRPAGTIHAFRYHLTRATPRVTPYDFRRTFANLMERAGIPRTRRRQYLGHMAKDITDLYEWHEVQRYLAEDAERLRTLLGEPPQGPRLQVVAS